MNDSTLPMADGQETIEGGSAWELSEAIRLMGEAQASGDPDQIATAMRRHAEALTNSANATMIPTLQHVLESVLQRELNKIGARLDNHSRVDLDRRTEESIRRQAQEKHLYAELDKLGEGQAGILAVSEATATDVKKLAGQVGDMAEALTATISRVSNVEEVVSEHGMTLATHGRHIQEVRTDVAAMQTRIDTLQAGLQEIRSRLAGLEADHAMFRKVLDANPQPEALKPHAGR